MKWLTKDWHFLLQSDSAAVLLMEPASLFQPQKPAPPQRMIRCLFGVSSRGGTHVSFIHGAPRKLPSSPVVFPARATNNVHCPEACLVQVPSPSHTSNGVQNDSLRSEP